MKIFVDTNVIIDFLVDREPFADDAEAVMDACVQDGNSGAFTGLSACNAVYILGKAVGRRRAELLVKEIAALLTLLPVRPEDVESNLGADHADFEDSLQISAARIWGADAIVTRDKSGFAGSPVRVFTPVEFLSAYRRILPGG